MHRPPQRQLTRRQRPLLRSLGFALGVGGAVVIFGDGVGLEVGQVSQLGLAETMVAEAFHGAADFRGGNQGAMGSAQCAGSGRRGPTGDDLALVAVLEPAVGVFEDFHLALSLLLEAGLPFDYAEVRELAEPKPPEAPALALSGKPDLKIYDRLLTVSLAGSGVCA